MSRQPGMLNLSGNIEVNAGAPLDSRSVVPTLADLTVAANFPYKYIGMRVTVQSTGDMYTLMGNDVTDPNNWKQMGSGDGQTIQVDELPTASSTEEGNIYQYVGDTTVNYIHGYFYECVEDDGSYSWQESSVQTKDYDDLTNRPVESSAVDMTEIIDPLPSDATDGVIYSTTERKIGRWIDGKPVYQKTVDCGNLPNTTTKNVAHGISNMDIAVGLKGMMIDSNDYIFNPLSALVQANSVWGVVLKADRTNIQLTTAANYSTLTHIKAIVTIQYTKTTD